MSDVLPDVLRPGLRVVMCGTAAGTVSAAKGAYYAGPGNRFWPILFAIGLTPRLFRPNEFSLLGELGIGLTDVAKTTSGADIAVHAFDRPRLAKTLRKIQPGCVAFNGKKAASLFLDVPTGQLAYGRRIAPPGLPPVFVLPSTSGAASGFWDPKPWFDLARALQ